MSNVGNTYFSTHLAHELHEAAEFRAFSQRASPYPLPPVLHRGGTSAVELHRWCLAPLPRDVRGCGGLSRACFVAVSVVIYTN